jgi:hypothetical protein
MADHAARLIFDFRFLIFEEGTGKGASAAEENSVKKSKSKIEIPKA